ncbi:hypothetical protein, partial [Cetobacterium somerae]|uniref:hypothetical protein n=1 Tax=Cetobacterium somerae TaxID=188913 RepID=UPI00211E18F9
NIMKERIGLIPTNIIADAGYGSLENYEFLSENKLKNFVKYNSVTDIIDCKILLENPANFRERRMLDFF